LTGEINGQSPDNTVLNDQGHITGLLTGALTRLGRRDGRGSDEALGGENFVGFQVQWQTSGHDAFALNREDVDVHGAPTEWMFWRDGQ
jgi:hypothetical protein